MKAESWKKPESHRKKQGESEKVKGKFENENYWEIENLKWKIKGKVKSNWTECEIQT